MKKLKAAAATAIIVAGSLAAVYASSLNSTQDKIAVGSGATLTVLLGLIVIIL